MVNQHGKGPETAGKAAKKNVPGGHYGIGLEEVAGAGVLQFKAGTAVKQRHIYSPGIRRIKVHVFIVQLPQRRPLQQAPEHKGVLHLGKANHIRQSSFGRSSPENPFGNGVALGIEAFPRPSALSQRGEFRIGDGSGVVPVVKKVLQVPEHDPKCIGLWLQQG